MDLTIGFNPSTVHDPNRWQPLRYLDPQGKTVTPTYIAPHWGHVAGFALPAGAALRSRTGPARYGRAAYRDQALALLGISSHLTDQQKMIAEYWARRTPHRTATRPLGPIRPICFPP